MFFFQKECFQRTAEDILVPPLWEKRGKNIVFCLLFLNGCRRRNLFFLVASCQHADKNQLVRRYTLDLDIGSAHGQPAWCRARPTSLDDDLVDVRWIHGLGGESLPTASYGILPHLKKKVFYAIRDGWRKFVTLGWVGAPNERTPFRVQSRCFCRSMSVEDSESRPFESSLSFSQADLGPTTAPEYVFSGFSTSLELSV